MKTAFVHEVLDHGFMVFVISIDET